MECNLEIGDSSSPNAALPSFRDIITSITAGQIHLDQESSIPETPVKESPVQESVQEPAQEPVQEPVQESPAQAATNPPKHASIATVAKEDPQASVRRRENHRLIEKRRRETINNGINELAEVLPDHSKKRSTVILKSIEYINELKQLNSTISEERDLLKARNQELVNELAEKNKRINELLLL